MSGDEQAWLEQVNWNSDGLVAAIAQDAESGKNLMLAWMNREALSETVSSGYACYWSRSRKRLWRKGEQSGNRQRIVELRLDCDADVILMSVEQGGGIACHTGRQSCFYRVYNKGQWQTVEPVLQDPKQIYRQPDD
ncbi:MAG: phosphoribosyl-AMP cyclohydrolase [Gammaproteobacteria bacterium]|nr:phosphoribosyl-AMP cyclohydrolase [Gammaproteobacteria bacterium]